MIRPSKRPIRPRLGSGDFEAFTFSWQWDATERRVVGEITQSLDLLQTEARGCNVVGEFIGVPDFFAWKALCVVGWSLRQLRGRFARSF